MSERIANVAEFKAMKDVGKPFLGNGGSVGKHDTNPPRLDLAYASAPGSISAARLVFTYRADG